MLAKPHVIQAEKHQMGGKPMLQPLPTYDLEHLDPFLLLHHHGPNTFAPNTAGLEVGPHPHKGIETVTVVVQGDTAHKDNVGNAGNVKAGGIQWMTAGSGISHDEGTSAAFNQSGGTLEILQLWLNLPSSLKNATPFYQGWQENEIPTLSLDGGRVHLKLFSGTWQGINGAHKALTDVHLATATLAGLSHAELPIPTNSHVLFYVIRGKVVANGKALSKGQLAQFSTDGGKLTLEGVEDDSLILLGYGTPYHEPIVAHGPFVLNTEAEIRQAYADFRQGRFGAWPTK